MATPDGVTAQDGGAFEKGVVECGLPFETPLGHSSGVCFGPGRRGRRRSAF